MYNIKTISGYSTAPSHKRNKALNQITSLEPDMIIFMTALTSVTILITHECLKMLFMSRHSPDGDLFGWQETGYQKWSKLLYELISNQLKKNNIPNLLSVWLLLSASASTKKNSGKILVARPGSTVTLMLRSILSIDTDRLRTYRFDSPEAPYNGTGKSKHIFFLNSAFD